MEKWYAITMIAFVVSMFVGLSFESYSKSQCKIEAVRAGKTTEDIEKICK